jgi:hypothetical protein
MIEATAPNSAVLRSAPLLDAIAEAYTAGDAPYGEHLFTQALDDGLPWDQVCAAAARGVARRYGEPDRG